MNVPELRIVRRNGRGLNMDGRYVLYWMTSARRLTHNFALDRAIEWCLQESLPLVIFEPLRLDYPYASHRFHRFVAQGMKDHAEILNGFGSKENLERQGVFYLPFVEREKNQGKGLLARLAKNARVVVADYFPTFFLNKMQRVAAETLPVACEQVDANGVFPLNAFDSWYTTAHAFRRAWQKVAHLHLPQVPNAYPLRSASLPSISKSLGKELEDIQAMPGFVREAEFRSMEWIQDLPIDLSVRPSDDVGGMKAGAERLNEFVKNKLERYGERSHPDENAASGLSIYLHFGHVGAHQILDAAKKQSHWSTSDIAAKANGSREGFLNAPAAFESFFDELVTWRELGFVRCHRTDDYASYAGLPAWAQKSLQEHAKDPRAFTYTREEFEAAKTHDEIWNAAQRQLLCEGRIQNYLRMLWGKKVLEWSDTPEQAFDTLIYLNDKYALDGRDPNSYTNIGWIFGAYDRAWGPERKIVGKIRYMTSDQTRKKLRLKQWLARFGDSSIPKSPRV